MSAATLLELADRCEREEPSQVLDAAICEAVRGDCIYPWPAYTSSIDAARTLSDWLLEIASDIDMPVVRLAHTDPVREVASYGARTLALAWCAASLRALASMEQTDG